MILSVCSIYGLDLINVTQDHKIIMSKHVSEKIDLNLVYSLKTVQSIKYITVQTRSCLVEVV